jgi:hypothetical protein
MSKAQNNKVKLNSFVSFSDYDGANDSEKLAAALAAAATQSRSLRIDRDIVLTVGVNLPNADVEVFGEGASITTPPGNHAFRRIHRGKYFEMYGLTFTGGGIAFYYDGPAIGDMPGGATPSGPFGTQYREYYIHDCRFLQTVGTEAIYLFGSREGTISNCYFETNKGIYTKYSINTNVVDCDAKNCVYLVFSDIGSEGLKIRGGTTLGCAETLKAFRTNGVQVSHVMWDYNDACITLTGVYEGSITNSYFSTRTSTPAIFMTNDGSFRTQHVSVCANASIRTNWNNASAIAMRVENSDFITIESNNILNWQANGLEYANCLHLKVMNNNINPKSGTGTYSISATSSDDSTVKIHGNTVLKPINRSVTRDLWANNGYVTENSGEVTWTTGATSYSFPHGLAMAPLKGGISLDPTSIVESAVRWWIGNVDATNITITMSQAPTVAASFSWRAQIKV